MKYLKMLGLAAAAAMAVMAFVGAGTASATVLCKEANLTTTCSANNKDYGEKTLIVGSLKGSGILEEVNGTGVLDTCTTSTLEGKTSNTGSATETVHGPIEKLTWEAGTTTCTHPTTTAVKGELEIHWITGTDNGTLTAKNVEVTINGLFGVSCIYESGGAKDLGTLTGGKPATININVVVPGNTNNSFLCPEEGRWTAQYSITSVGGVAGAGLWVSEK